MVAVGVGVRVGGGVGVRVGVLVGMDVGVGELAELSRCVSALDYE